MVKGLVVASETAIHEVTPLPREVNRHSSFKKIAEHLLLKGISYVIVTPFFAASLVETVQSEIACESPGVFDCIVEGIGRLVSFTSAQPTRLLPIWKLLLPTVVYGLSHYIIASLAKYRVSVTMKNDLRHITGRGIEEDGERADDRTIYETYYPELVATFTGNLLADTLLYPLETIIHRLYLQGTRTIIDNTDTGLEVLPIVTRYDGALDCYTTIVAEEGFTGLYKGFGALLLQYALHVAVLKLTRVGFDLLSGMGGTSAQPPSMVVPPPTYGAAAYDPLRGTGSPRLRTDYTGPGNPM
jgi:solute carrier family 25 protein 46